MGSLWRKKRTPRSRQFGSVNVLFWWNVAACVIHLGQMAVMGFLYLSERRDLVYPLYASYTSWVSNPNSTEAIENACRPTRGIDDFGGNMRVTPAWRHSGLSLSLHWMMFGFFALSGIFQGLAAATPYAPWKGVVSTSILRFVEYAFSASLMIASIGLQIGIFSARTLALLAALTAITMLWGIVAEKLAQTAKNAAKQLTYMPSDDIDKDESAGFRVLRDVKWAAWFSHLGGWVTQTAVWTVILVNFHGSQDTCGSPERAPNFVYAIVYCELFLFVCFGFVQTAYLAQGLNDDQAEFWYTGLSLTSKTLLGWLVYGGNFAG